MKRVDGTVLSVVRRHSTLALVMLFFGALTGPTGRAAELAKPAEVFKTTNVWTVHLTFTPDQWEAMEPTGGPGGFRGFDGPRGPGGRGPGGPGGFGGPGGPGGFGPGMFLAPGVLRLADQDRNATLSQVEFHGLAEKWFSEWDTTKIGKLNADQLRTGLNAALSPPGFGPPGAAGPGGGPGGGRPPGMNLQGPEGKRNGLASMMGIEFPYVHADLEFAGRHFTNVAVRYKGNGTFMESRGSLKRSLKVDLNQFTKGQTLAGMSQLNLHNNVTDASWMNEVLSHRLFRDAGVPAPRTAYARVFVTVPGKFDKQYLGLYSLVEDVGASFAEEHFNNAKGSLFKPVTPTLFADLGPDWKNYNQTYDPKGKVPEADKQRVMEFCRFVSNAADAEFAARLGEFVELDEFARYMAALVFLADLDGILGPGQNLYLYLHPQTRKLQFLPWDLDHSFGQFPLRGTQEQRENLSLQKPWQGENRFLERAFKVEAFQQLYRARLAEFNATIFQPERFYRQVDELAAALRPAVEEESTDKVARFDKVVAGDSAGGGAPGGFGGFGQPTVPIKPFVKIRARSVSDQLAGKSPGQTLGEFGFGGGPGGPGGRGGRPGGPGAFGPGNFVAGPFMAALDADKNGVVAHDEFVQGFDKWFIAWNTDKSGQLTEDQLRTGMNRDLAPDRNGFPGAPGFGPPAEPRPPEQR